MTEKLVAVNDTEKERREQSYAGPFIMRRKICSTAYEVAVYFSETSQETLTDKISRMIRNAARQ
jgi:hypothetical protein